MMKVVRQGNGPAHSCPLPHAPRSGKKVVTRDETGAKVTLTVGATLQCEECDQLWNLVDNEWQGYGWVPTSF